MAHLHRFVPHTLVFLFGAAFAQAQDDPAAVLFHEGREDAKRGDYQAACPKFEKSFAVAAKPGTLLNLADCHEKRGKLARALASYERLLPLLAPGDERVQVAEGRIAELQKKVARLTLTGRLPLGALVKQDGEEVLSSEMNTPRPMDPGGHVVEIKQSGKPERRLEIVLREAESRTLDLSDPETVPPAVSRPAPVSKAEVEPRRETLHGAAPPPRDRSAAYAVGGAGGVAMLVAGVTGAMALSKKGTMDSHCDGASACDQQGLDAASSGRSLATISNIAFGLGALGLGVGGYLLFTSDDKVSRATLAPTTGGLAVSLGRKF